MLFNLFGSKKTPAAESAHPPEVQEPPKPAKADPNAPSATQALALKELEAAARNAAAVPVVEAAPEPAPEPAPAPVPPPEPAPLPVTLPASPSVVPAQTEIIKATQEDVTAAYKIFLRREPENRMVVESRLGLSREKLFVNFITATEFLKYPENINLILQTARQLELKAAAVGNEEAK
jgi:hypothetical protein